MQAVRPKSLALFMLGMVSSLCFMGCGPRLSANVDFIPNITYAQGYVSANDKGEDFSLKALKLDVLTPNDDPSPNKPAVLMIHGGGFDGGSRDDEQLVALADRLASEGYVCFLSDYRLVDDNPPAPPEYSILPLGTAIHASFVDAKAAIRFIRANHRRYGVNPDRIAVFGESAGGFAALAAGISDDGDFEKDRADLDIPTANNANQDAQPQAILEFWGSADLILDEFSQDDPPILIVHGTLDFNFGTFFTSALNVQSRAEDNNIPHRFVPLPGEGHGAWDARVDGDDLADITLEFLDEYL